MKRGDTKSIPNLPKTANNSMQEPTFPSSTIHQLSTEMSFSVATAVLLTTASSAQVQENNPIATITDISYAFSISASSMSSFTDSLSNYAWAGLPLVEDLYFVNGKTSDAAKKAVLPDDIVDNCYSENGSCWLSSVQLQECGKGKIEDLVKCTCETRGWSLRNE